MLELYNMLEQANPNHQNIVMTVVSGEHLGEKALISNRELVWESEECGFFSEHLQQVEGEPSVGLISVAGETVYSESCSKEKQMVICGGGHVAIPIIRIGLMVGFHVTVIEDRPAFADNARKAGAHQVICQDFETALAGIEGSQDTFFVIVTRGHRFDQTCLGAIALKPRAYMGMIGSRRRIAMVKDLLEEQGIPKDKLSDLHAPIGLNIGAQTPEEIAVAVLAEIIEVKNQSGRTGGFSKEIMSNLLYSPTKDHKVLATIVRRRGSAPREVGTKMLVLSDGRSIGTIGGGCAEAEVLRKAMLKLRTQDESPELIHADFSSPMAGEEGMVCGGQMDVLLEVI